MNKEEREWLGLIHELPCLLEHTGDCGGPIEADHITSGGRRLGHLWAVPLCHFHHHWDSPLPIGDAFHKGSKAWQEKHGNQLDLLNQLRGSLGMQPIQPVTKIVPRY